jgi:hypothetical protein
MATHLNIAVLLGATGDGRWTATVVCEEGPTALRAARPYEQASRAADADVRDMVTYGPYNRATVWRLDTTAERASDLFRRLDSRAFVRLVMALGYASEVTA